MRHGRKASAKTSLDGQLARMPPVFDGSQKGCGLSDPFPGIIHASCLPVSVFMLSKTKYVRIRSIPNGRPRGPSKIFWAKSYGEKPFDSTQGLSPAILEAIKKSDPPGSQPFPLPASGTHMDGAFCPIGVPLGDGCGMRYLGRQSVTSRRSHFTFFTQSMFFTK